MHVLQSKNLNASDAAEERMDQSGIDKIVNAFNEDCSFVRPEHVHELLTEQEAAAYLGLSVSGLRKWRFRRCGPKYAKFGKIIRYRRSDLDTFVQSRIVTPESPEQK